MKELIQKIIAFILSLFINPKQLDEYVDDYIPVEEEPVYPQQVKKIKVKKFAPNWYVKPVKKLKHLRKITKHSRKINYRFQER